MEKRAHADRCRSLPQDLPDDMGTCLLMYHTSLTTWFKDLMIEVGL